MSEANSVGKNGEALNVDAGPDERNGIDPDERVHRPDSLGAVLRKFFSGPQRPGTAAATRDLKQDRTRALVLLIGGIVGSVLLFVGIFSTPPARLGERERDHAQPNLGRREPTGAPRLASATPLLNAQVQADDSGQDRVSEADVHNTSQRDFSEKDPTPAAPDDSLALRAGPSPASDRAPIYHRDGTTGTMTTYGYGTPAANVGLTRTQTDSSYPGTFNYGTSNSQAALPTTATTPKSSIVFVRTSVATASPSTSALVSPGTFEHPTVLSAGSHLIARLESAISSALKAPVVAVIEYNYEKDGVILIPAGTKAIGELQQASINGYVGIVFHTLQMPDGRNEKIEAMAMDLQNEPLKGKVTGTSKGRKFLTRTLSGVGTIAAYVVGAGGSGLGQPITGETLLRDRFASNIASAGDQELTNAAFSQNIVVTVPAQTRFYIVFRKAAVEPAASSSPLPSTVRSSGAEMPTAQELRELLDLKREINRMYEASAAPPNSTKP